MKKIKVVVTGAAGRMGQTIIKKVLSDKGLKLVGALEVSGHRNLGQDIGKILKTKNVGVKISDNIIDLFANTDAVIDFTLPHATVDHAKYAAQARIVHVIGTTGLSNKQLKKIEYASKHATIIKSGNMSLIIVACLEAYSIFFNCLFDKPVVPITCTILAWAAYFA
jgi:4-hydroxy-tetrahydrodipicolinate reductase